MSLEDLDYSDDVGLYDDIFDDIQPDEPTAPPTTNIQPPAPIQPPPPQIIQRPPPTENLHSAQGILDPNKSDQGKIFVGALNWGTDEKMLQEYFSKFGEVVDCVIMREPNTGRSRGFGFLNFSTSEAVDSVLGVRHFLDGKSIDPKRAVPKDDQQKTEKIFVGGIAPSVDEFDLKDFFSEFGKVLDATLMLDRETGRPRGFGFVTFESAEGVDRCIAKQGTLMLKDKLIEVKRAQPKGGFPPRGIPQNNPVEIHQQQIAMQQQMAMMQQNPMMMQMWMQMMQAQQMAGAGGVGAEGMMMNMNGYGAPENSRDATTSIRPVIRRDRERPKKAEGEYISSKYRALANAGAKPTSKDASPDRSETSRTRSPERNRSRSRERSRIRDRSPKADSRRHRPY